MRLTPAALAALAALSSCASPAYAHDWYPPYCCSGGDCAPIAGDRVRATADGFLVDGRFKVRRSEVKDSMDGRYHGCFPKPDDLKCFFAPPSGS